MKNQKGVGATLFPFLIKKNMLKTYAIKEVESSLVFIVNNKAVRIEFRNGNSRYPAKYTTGDPIIQKAIEQDERFGEIIDLIEQYDNGKEKTEPISTDTEGLKQITHVINLQDAKNYLGGKLGIPLSELTSKAKIKTKAREHKVCFPNLA